MLRITGGYLKGRTVREVGGRVRHTSSIVRKAIFDVIDVEGALLLELFCGSCVVTIEALSRGAGEAHVVDVSGKSIGVCKTNLKDLGIYEKVRIFKADARIFVKSPGISYNVIFMDPPYDHGIVNEVLKNMKPDLLKKNGIVVIERSKRESIDPPEFLEVLKERTYGDTVLSFLRKITL